MDRKTVFITGAANGIGRATANKFAQRGWFIGAYDLDESGLKSLCEELGSENCIYKVMDVTSEESVDEAMTQFSEKTGGKMDVLVSNAGIIVQEPFENSSPRAYKKLIDVNAFGMVNVIFKSLPLLKKSEGARIVITSSSSAMFGIPNFAVYGATKAFLKNLTEALSTELAKYKIEVSSIMPLFVKTQMMEKIEKKYSAELSPYDVADKIFYASTEGKKRHYLIGKNLRMMRFLNRVLPTKTYQKVLKKFLKVE